MPNITEPAPPINPTPSPIRLVEADGLTHWDSALATVSLLAILMTSLVFAMPIP